MLIILHSTDFTTYLWITAYSLKITGVPWCLSRLRIQRCHCCGTDPCCGTGSIPGPETSACHRCSKKKKKTKEKENHRCRHHRSEGRSRDGAAEGLEHQTTEFGLCPLDSESRGHVQSCDLKWSISIIHQSLKYTHIWPSNSTSRNAA